MPFVQAKCTECGGILAVDNEQKAAICQFCGKPYIVEDAVNNYITYNVTNNTTNHNYGEGAVVNVYENQFSVSTIMERAFMFLENDDFKSADNYCEKVLDIEPENALAYLGKLLADLQIKRKIDLKDCATPFEDNPNYLKLIRFCDSELKAEMEHYSACAQKNKASLKEELAFVNKEIEILSAQIKSHNEDDYTRTKLEKLKKRKEEICQILFLLLNEVKCPLCGIVIPVTEALDDVLECPICGRLLKLLKYV